MLPPPPLPPLAVLQATFALMCLAGWMRKATLAPRGVHTTAEVHQIMGTVTLAQKSFLQTAQNPVVLSALYQQQVCLFMMAGHLDVTPTMTDTRIWCFV